VAITSGDDVEVPNSGENVHLSSFSIDGLFGYLNHQIIFPDPEANGEPSLLIIEGQNGSGKTTILKMVSGIVNGLDFGEFRKFPFRQASLEFSNGERIGVERRDDPMFPIQATFRDMTVPLRNKSDVERYSPEETRLIDNYRAVALPLVNNIKFDLIPIERATYTAELNEELTMDPRTGKFRRNQREQMILAGRVRDFLRDAQVNYRRFFQADDLELLPRILRSFENDQSAPSADKLISKVSKSLEQNKLSKRFGLETNDRELETLLSLLETPNHSSSQQSLSVLSAYTESHESLSNSRNLIANRLVQFENIMDEFLVGKSVKINSRDGLSIIGTSGTLTERNLSSGEFHFLYMMVAALLCQRTGTIIAIDEPELSLHVSWQRRLVSGLSKCAAGASPLFFLATHATAISANHKYAVQQLSAIE
jgi:predicted ATPase